MTENSLKNPEVIADACAEKIFSLAGKNPENYAEHAQALEDLKLDLVKQAAELYPVNIENREEFLWTLAHNLPDFNVEAFYQKRMSLVSLGAAVFIGWLLGGLLSGFLDFFALGGDILRALAIFFMVWLGEYLSANPGARKMFLTILGLGGLARFGSMLASGVVRFTGFASFRQLVFGSLKPNIFKGVWLLCGALFMLVFFSKKISGFDLMAFKESVRQQIGQDLRLVCFVLESLGQRDNEISQLQTRLKTSESSPQKTKELVQALLGLLDALDPDKRAFILEKIAAAGFAPHAPDQETLVWNEKEHAPLYTTVGLVKNGDRCKILSRAANHNGKIMKGHVQKIM